MWGVRISVVRSDNLTEMKYRHQGPSKEVCLGLLYNGKEEGGHYSPLVRVDGQFCPEHKPFRTVWDLKQHLERCPGNTSTSKRQPVACDICKMGKYYNPKEIKQHKELKHGW